jgi:hypothetical protein
MVNLETELRSALAERASTVPVTIAEQLCSRNYRPRAARHRGVIIAAGAACAAAAAGGAYAAASAHGPAPAALRQTVHLDGYSLTLATGSPGRDRRCAPAPGHGRPETVSQAGGVFRAYGDGCLHITLGPPRAPADAAPVTVGTYHGYLRVQPAAGKITLYLDASTRSWLVFAATRTGLTARQLTDLAERGIPPCSPQLEYAPPCVAG